MNCLRQPRISRMGIAASAVFGLLIAGVAAAEEAERIGALVKNYALDSGAFDNAAAQPATVYSHTVEMAPDVPWTRLMFGAISLPPGSYIRVTSLLDGESQTFDAAMLELWRGSTAYFNGSKLLVELIAGPNTTGNAINIKDVMVGHALAPQGGVASICSGTDDRVASTDAAVGRLLVTKSDGTYVCTGFIIDTPAGVDKCHLSAGHCFKGWETAVLQFDVPASNVNCTLNQPPVTDQFPVTNTKVAFSNEGKGEDWSVFRCGVDSVDGETTYEEQAAAKSLGAAPATGSPVRVTGYGADGGTTPNACSGCVLADVDATKNYTQQTDLGDLLDPDTQPGSIVHTADTCGGDSGAPIIDESTGDVIGIHTHGKCKEDPFYNSGTPVDHGPLQDAIAACKDVSQKNFSQACDNPGGVGTTDPPCDEAVESRGKFAILVDCAYAALLVGCPNYDHPTKRYNSPTLIDPRRVPDDIGTIIARSAPFRDEDTTDTTGAVVGSLGTIVKDSDFAAVPAGYEGPAGTWEVHTEIVDLNLRVAGYPPSTPPCVRAGQVMYGISKASIGEVESHDDPSKQVWTSNFPATSFFNVYVEIDLPMCGALPGPVLLENNDPLLIYNDSVTNLPPRVVYLHGQTKAVPVYFRTGSTGWDAGNRFGWLVLAGHSLDPDVDEEAFDALLAEVDELSALSVGCDGAESTGTGNTWCVGGGQRDYAYPVGDANGTMTDLYIGTHDAAMKNYSNWCVPPGWTYAIEPNVRKLRHGEGKTAHGGVSATAGFCPTVIHFQGPPIPAPLPAVLCGAQGATVGWIFGFDNPSASHDVDWLADARDANTGNVTSERANWKTPVGDGFGPVHGPSIDIPAVSDWGLVVMALLVIAAGTVVIRRYRVQNTYA